MQLPREIFKAYDIRGIVGKTLTARNRRSHRPRHRLGSARARHQTQSPSAATAACRARNSPPPLPEASRNPASTSSTSAWSPRPWCYFAAHHLGTQCGVMVTGSHNPPGLQRPENGAGRRDAFRRCHPGPARRASNWASCSRAAAVIAKQDIAQAYIDRITSDIKLARPMKIAVDCGNGVAGAYAPATVPRARLRGAGTVLRSRRQFPQPSPRPVGAGKPAGPDRRVANRRCRIGPGVRRRRRPPGRRHQGWRTSSILTAS